MIFNIARARRSPGMSYPTSIVIVTGAQILNHKLYPAVYINADGEHRSRGHLTSDQVTRFLDRSLPPDVSLLVQDALARLSEGCSADESYRIIKINRKARLGALVLPDVEVAGSIKLHQVISGWLKCL